MLLFPCSYYDSFSVPKIVDTFDPSVLIPKKQCCSAVSARNTEGTFKVPPDSAENVTCPVPPCLPWNSKLADSPLGTTTVHALENIKNLSTSVANRM
jgi:hypothetical protein